MTSLEGKLVNSQTSEIAIYLRIYLHVSFHRCGINTLHARSTPVIHEQTRIAVILNNSEMSGLISNGRALSKCTAYTKFGGQKGGLSNPPRTPPVYGLEKHPNNIRASIKHCDNFHRAETNY